MKSLIEYINEASILNAESNLAITDKKVLKQLRNEVVEFLKLNYDKGKNCKVSNELNSDGKFEVTCDKALTAFSTITSITNGNFVFTQVPEINFARANQLSSLEGCPSCCSLYFGYCDKLTSLQGLPDKINGDLAIKNLPLTSLNGCPSLVIGSFSISNIPVETLEGCPHTVGEFWCRYMPNIKNCVGMPKKVFREVRIEFNPEFTSLKGLAKMFGASLMLRDNTKLKSLKGAPETINGDLSVTNCKALKSLDPVKRINGDLYTGDSGVDKISRSGFEDLGIFIKGWVK